jgi:hypothetical protein
MRRSAVLAQVALAALLGAAARGQSLDAIDRLVADLGEDDPQVRHEAATALLKVGQRAPADLEHLARSLAGGAAPPGIQNCIFFLLEQTDGTRARIAHDLGLNRTVGAIPALILILHDENPEVRKEAAYALGEMGPAAARAVPTLRDTLRDPAGEVRREAAGALSRVGPPAWSALSDLADTMEGDADPWVRDAASFAVQQIGIGMKADGSIRWWIVPRVFWKELTGLVVLLVAWFALASRFPARRPASVLEQLALIGATAVLPVVVTCSAVHYAVTREWAQGYLPDSLVLVSFPVAATLSMALVGVLASVWICQRKHDAGTTIDALSSPTRTDQQEL